MTTDTTESVRLPARSRLVPLGVGVLGAVAAMALGRVIWPDPAGAPTPSAALMPFFILISIIEAASFGAGLAFAIVGLPALRRLAQPNALTVAAYLAIVFMLVSWWPHDNLHRVLSHGDFAGLARIEYIFHVTSIAAAAITGLFYLRTVRSRT
jgi:hypothetical protein